MKVLAESIFNKVPAALDINSLKKTSLLLYREFIIISITLATFDSNLNSSGAATDDILSLNEA
jgi:hypothetical protein